MNIARQLAGALSRRNARRRCSTPAVSELANEKLVLAARSFLRRVGS
jgi:hypothetical protein